VVFIYYQVIVLLEQGVYISNIAKEVSITRQIIYRSKNNN